VSGNPYFQRDGVFEEFPSSESACAHCVANRSFLASTLSEPPLWVRGPEEVGVLTGSAAAMVSIGVTGWASV
jgi:type IV secretory pathway TrbD component